MTAKVAMPTTATEKLVVLSDLTPDRQRKEQSHGGSKEGGISVPTCLPYTCYNRSSVLPEGIHPVRQQVADEELLEPLLLQHCPITKSSGTYNSH